MYKDWLSIAQKIQAIAQTGLFYSHNVFDTERYQELRDISLHILENLTEIKSEKIRDLFANETGYQTPKVDIRTTTFDELGRLLMVREKSDDCWALPGGWADIGLSPAEVAEKEVFEESGFIVKATRLLGVFDLKKNITTEYPFSVYKIFIGCELIGGEKKNSIETSDVNFFAENELPELSLGRNSTRLIKLMFEYYRDKNKVAMFE